VDRDTDKQLATRASETMVFMRKKDSKPKKQGDFTKKKAKVGRKVKRGNVTEIKVASKRINIPLQNQITAKGPQDEQETLDMILKQLQHYSAASRRGALDDLKDFVSTSVHIESFIALMFAPSMEVLFDEDRDTRADLLSLLTSILNRFPSSVFQSVLGVTITYICSGLTSLHKVPTHSPLTWTVPCIRTAPLDWCATYNNAIIWPRLDPYYELRYEKGIRRDSLTLLQQFSDYHAALLVPHVDKVLYAGST
jgi:hypothetical protein